MYIIISSPQRYVNLIVNIFVNNEVLMVHVPTLGFVFFTVLKKNKIQ